MVRLLIIADDFTGALDTGVQFATRGATTRVVTNADYDFKQADARGFGDGSGEPPPAARRGLQYGVPCGAERS